MKQHFSRNHKHCCQKSSEGGDGHFPIPNPLIPHLDD
jgi:hypothetical protein